MAIPSGSGTEVLKRYIKEGQDDTETKVIDGVADHIYTVLSIIACNQATTNKVLYIKLNGLFLTREASGAGSGVVGPSETFVWNDKFVISGTDELILDGDSGSNFDCIVSYIDQDWT